MDSLEEKTPMRFEDLDDMLDFSYEKVEDAVYHYVLITKLMLPLDEVDRGLTKKLLLDFIDGTFDDMYKRVTPLVEKNGRDSVVYGLIQKRD